MWGKFKDWFEETVNYWFFCERQAKGWPCKGRKCLGKKPH